MKQVLIVGLTGNIGAGKSYVAQLLRRLGFPVYDSDHRAKYLIETDPTLIAKLKIAFGEDLYDENGRLNRKLLAQRAFPSPEATLRLNSLVHPVVAQDFAAWCQKYIHEGQCLLFKEAALIYEAGTERDLDAVWLVAAPPTMRSARVQSRDGLSPAEIEARMARQWPEEWKRKRADFVLENDGTRRLAPQLRQAFRQLEQLRRIADKGA